MYLGLFVLDAVGLVNHEVAPVELLEDRFLFDAHLVWRDADIPLSRQNHVTYQCRLHNTQLILNTGGPLSRQCKILWHFPDYLLPIPHLPAPTPNHVVAFTHAILTLLYIVQTHW